MPQTAALDPALLMYIRYVCTHAYVSRSIASYTYIWLPKVTDLDGQDSSRSLSVDDEAFPGGEQAPTQERPRRSDPDLSAVR